MKTDLNLLRSHSCVPLKEKTKGTQEVGTQSPNPFASRSSDLGNVRELKGTQGNARPNDQPTPGPDRAEVWLRDVLGADVVPLDVVVNRAKLEGIPLAQVYALVKELCISLGAQVATRYIKLPKAIWGLPKPCTN